MRAYHNCKFCRGRGCLACEGEAEKDYKKQFPNGPQPIATISTEGMTAEDKNALLTRLFTLPPAVVDEKLMKGLVSPVGQIVRQLQGEEAAIACFRQRAVQDTLEENFIKEQQQQDDAASAH